MFMNEYQMGGMVHMIGRRRKDVHECMSERRDGKHDREREDDVFL